MITNKAIAKIKAKFDTGYSGYPPKLPRKFYYYLKHSEVFAEHHEKIGPKASAYFLALVQFGLVTSLGQKLWLGQYYLDNKEILFDKPRKRAKMKK